MKYIYPVAIAAALLFVLAGTAVKLQWFSTSNAYTAPAVAATPSAPAPAAATSSAASYTLADVAEHASASDCWTAINGSVYNLTPFIPDHPGGDKILAVCGIDGTSLFEGQHSSDARANAELATLKIGTLAP